MGQVYGYVHGDIGVQLKLFGLKKKFTLCGITAGAIIAGGMPNPTWMKGVFGVEGELFNGAINFRTSAKFKIGEVCEIYTDPLKELVIVESITPGEKKRGDAEKKSEEELPSIFTAVKIATNVKMNTPCNLYVEDSEGKQIPRMYKFQFESAKILKVSDNMKMVPIALKDRYTVNETSKGYEFKIKSETLLEPYTTYAVIVRVKIQEEFKNGYNNPIGEDGMPYTDKQCRRSDTVFFKTGGMPTEIVKDNIKYAFPMNKQYEAFVKEGDKGYIVLEYDQSKLIENRETNAENQGLIGEFINRTNPKEKPIIFYYEYWHNAYKGNPGIVFDLKKLAKDNIYSINFYVIKKAMQQKDAKFKREDTTLVIASSKYFATENMLGGGSKNNFVGGSGGESNDIGNSNKFNQSMDKIGAMRAGIKNPVKQWVSNKLDSRVNPNPYENNISNKFDAVQNSLNVVTVVDNMASLNSIGNIGSMQGTGNQQIYQTSQTFSGGGGQGAGSSYANVRTQDVALNNQGYIGIDPSLLENNFGVSSRTHIRNKVDTNKTSVLENSLSETSYLVKEHSRLASKMKNAKLTTIFNYSFHTSRYGSIEEKMRDIEVRTTLRSDDPDKITDERFWGGSSGHKNYMSSKNSVFWDIVVHLRGYNGPWTNPIFRGLGNVDIPLQLNYMPARTTAEEVFGGKAFEDGSNAEYQPSMFQFENIHRNDPPFILWNVYCMPFLNKLRTHNIANIDNLTLREFEGVQNLPLSNNGYFKATRYMNLYDEKNSTKKEYYEPRLSDKEISEGKINRKVKKNNKISYLYKNKIYTSYHFLYAAALASHIYNKGGDSYFCKKGANGNITIKDNMKINGKDAGHHLEASYPKIREKADIFYTTEANALKSKINGLDVCFKSRCGSYWEKNCLRKLYENVYNFSSLNPKMPNIHSNLFYLARLWNDNDKKNLFDESKFKNLRDLKIGDHRVYIRYLRLGEKWVEIKDVPINGR